MHHMHVETRIEAPVEHVWEFLCDTSHWDDWDPRHPHSDFSGPVDGVGTTWVESGKPMGFEMKQTYKVVEVEPQRLLHFHSDQGPMEMYYRLDPDGDATRVIVESDYEIPSKMPDFFDDLIARGWVDRYATQALADFKAHAETKVPAHA